ncbi:hypothetical protein D3C85_1114190 [compost metagenome]
MMLQFVAPNDLSIPIMFVRSKIIIKRAVTMLITPTISIKMSNTLVFTSSSPSQVKILGKFSSIEKERKLRGSFS